MNEKETTRSRYAELGKHTTFAVIIGIVLWIGDWAIRGVALTYEHLAGGIVLLLIGTLLIRSAWRLLRWLYSQPGGDGP